MARGGFFLTAKQVDAAVRELYNKNGYTVLSEVRNGTGYSRSPRTADMLAISTWPSRGLFAEGIEIKVSKSDLLSELANPAKADEIAKYCAHWWVAAPEGMTDGCMIPPNWGVISVSDKLKAKVEKKAAPLEPAPWDALLVCSVLRNFAESYVHKSEVEPRITKAREEERASSERKQDYRLKELEGAIKAFEQHSGVSLAENKRDSWELGRIGQAVKLIVDMRGRPLEELIKAREALVAGASAIDAALGTIERKSA